MKGTTAMMLRNTLLAAAGFVVAIGMSPNAHASLLPFTIDSVPAGGTSALLNADALNFSTVAVVTQNGGVQHEQGYAQLNVLTLGGNTVTPNGGLGNNWLIYVTYNADVTLGSFANGSIGPVTSFTFSMFADMGVNDTYNNAGTNIGTVTGTSGDQLIGTGSLSGSNNTAGFNSNGGPEFSVLSTFGLTSFGDTIFTAPVPFYDFLFSASTSSQAGNVTPGPGNNQVSITSQINSSFEVPEPASLALLGSGLFALGGLNWRSRRQSHSKQS
jgi:hypothetical protein